MIRKKILLKIICFALCASYFVGVQPTSISAHEETNISTEHQSSVGNMLINDDIVKIADQYICFDKNSNMFTVDTIGLKRVLDTESYQKVLTQVNTTNKYLQSTLNTQENVDIKIHSTNGEEIILKQSMARAWGKDAVEIYWNFARVFISAGSLRLALQCGFAIGTIYAPARIIQAVCSILGIGASYINHGIWFDYNYLIGVACGNFGLQ